jgi:glutaredoxin
MPAPAITLFTQPDCPDCAAAKSLLRGARVPFTERDIRSDRQALKALIEMGLSVTPVLVIQGRPAIAGFDREAILQSIGHGRPAEAEQGDSSRRG